MLLLLLLLLLLCGLVPIEKGVIWVFHILRLLVFVMEVKAISA